MPAQGLELLWCPAPILEHLAGRFDKVTDGASTMETGKSSSRNKVVDTMPKLMEENDDLVVLKQAGFLSGRF